MGSRLLKGLVVGSLLGTILFAGTSFFRPAAVDRTTVPVIQGPFEQWSLFRGTLSARTQDPVSSPLEGAATLIFLAEEGTLIEPGDLVARFDDAKKKETKVQLQAAADQAEAEYNALKLAEIPLERAQLLQEVDAAHRDRQDAETWLADTRQLADEELASPNEVAQAQARLNRAESAWQLLQQKLELTEKHIHPARLLQFKSRSDAARQALETADLELQQTKVFAASSGRLIYQPLHLNGTFRTVRPGDTVYRNQPFALIADLKDPLVSVDVPENELMLLPPDAPVSVTPIALPDLHLPGRIERLGSTALGEGVALPHCRLDACQEPIAALLTLASPIDYDAPDDDPVDLVFALIVPKAAADEHLSILSNLAELLIDDSNREALRGAASHEDLFRAINDLTRGRAA